MTVKKAAPRPVRPTAGLLSFRCVRTSSRSLRLLVDRAFRELGQQFVCLLLLRERLLEQVENVLVAELLGPGAEAAVGGDLVVLDLLGRGDQARVHDVRL